MQPARFALLNRQARLNELLETRVTGRDPIG
jgi:hypothetical protein